MIEQQRLTEAAAAAKPLAEADRIKAALLAAVSHELRTPLASAKAAVASLRSSEMTWTPAEQADLLATADESLDSLTRLMANLLDLSRLQAGAMSASLHPVALDTVVARALDELGPTGEAVTLQVPADLPAVQADETLLERVVANLVANAARHSPPDQPVMLTGSALADRVELRVIDRGPGIPRRRPGADVRAVRTVPRGPAPRVWGSGSRCPAASPRRWAPPSSRRTPRAAGSRWCCPCPSRRQLPVVGRLSWRPPAGTDGDTD